MLFLILFTTSFVKGQNQDNTLQKILDLNLIEQKQVKDFKENQDRIKTKNATSYLYGLFQCQYKNITGGFFSEMGSHDIFDNEKLTEEEQKKENQELTEYLIKLKKCDLVTEKQFNEFQKKINANSYSYKLKLLSEITFEAMKVDYMAPEKLKRFADKLKNNGIVETQYKELIAAIDNEKIKNPIDLLSYCSKSVIIDKKNYSKEPENYLELIHKKTAEIMPELAFSNFEFKIVEDSKMSDEDTKFYDFIVSIQSGGKNYKQNSFYRLYTPSTGKYSAGGIDSQQYYKIFNKILTDLHSPYRLHEIEVYSDNDNLDEKVFGIMALTKEQEKALQESESYFRPSYEDFKNKPTTAQIEKVIEEYQKIGLFAHLSPLQINEAKEKVAEQENRDYNEVLSAFPNMIYWYDTELGNLEDPYAELLKEFSVISKNEFNPTQIINKFDIEKSKKTTLKFKLGTKSYSKVFKINNDWIDVDFFDFVKSIVKENKLKGQFYELYTGGQDAQVVYFTKEQYDYIRANKLLIFWDDKLIEED
ncbi:hypothetical protein [Flavobacterium reichenbachii]|nr:hypothetical protein [Flavobacterium reichenbachii]OXB11680.1 hypothetical protein B0A68_20790 [Flavobacterium reichenbachii]